MKKRFKVLFCLAALTLTLSSCGTSHKNSNPDDQYAIYELAQKAGYTGTYEEWLESIKGEDGSSFLSGTGAPGKDLGKDGDSYLDLSNNDFYKKDNGIWSKVGNLTPTGSSNEGLGDGYEFFGVSCLLHDDKLESYRNYKNIVYFAIPYQFSYEFVSWSASSKDVVIEYSDSDWNKSATIYSNIAGNYEVTIKFDYKNIHKSLTFPFIVSDESVTNEVIADDSIVKERDYIRHDFFNFNDISFYEVTKSPNGEILEKRELRSYEVTVLETEETYHDCYYNGYCFENSGTYTFRYDFVGTNYPSYSISINVGKGIDSKYGYAFILNYGNTKYKVGEAFDDKIEVMFDDKYGRSIRLVKGIDYTLNIEEGYVFEVAGSYQVVISFIDSDLEQLSFDINVEEKGSTLLNNIFSSISENYNVYLFDSDGFSPYYTRTENYFFNWDTETGFYLHDGVVRNLVISQDESNNVVISGGNKVCDGFNTDYSKHYAESLDYPMEAQGYMPFSKIEVSEEDTLSMSVEGEENVFTISSNLAIQLLDLVGYGSLALNYQVSTAQLIEITLETSDGSTIPAYLYEVELSYNGKITDSVSFCITEVDQANILELDSFVENPGTASDTIDASVQLALDTVRCNNFIGLYSSFGENEYSTYAVDENSQEWFVRSDKYGDQSSGLIKIGEGYDVDAGVYEYSLVEGEVSPTLTSDLADELFEFHRPNNWYGYSDGTGVTPLDFSEMWILSEVERGDQSEGNMPYIKYSLHDQAIAEEWSQQAWLYSDNYINSLKSRYGYTFVGLSMYLVDTDYDGYFDSITLGLDCTTSDFAGKISWDTMGLSSIGEYENEAVKRYLDSVTPIL